MAYVENVPRLNIDKYYSLLSKPAAGLAFDLDGTALDSSNALPLKLKTVLDVKLRAGVPMIVATGRGIGSTDEMIVSQLSKNSLSNLYIANYNGCLLTRFDVVEGSHGQKEVKPVVLFEAPLTRGEEIFNQITTKSAFKDDLITQQSEEVKFASKVRPYGITLVFEDGKIPNISTIKAFLEENEYKSDEVQVLFSGKTYDIISAKGGKNNAILQVANFLSINPEDIIRLGDQAGDGENDHDMLINGRGFYVGKSPENNHSLILNVYDSLGNRILGSDAMQSVVSGSNLNTNYALGPDNFNDPEKMAVYLNQYDSIAHFARSNFKDLASKHESEILANNSLVSITTGNRENIFSKLFTFNGAIKISKDELDSLPDSPLRDFLFSPSGLKSNDSNMKLRNMLNYGNSSMYYCRAENYYAAMKEALSVTNRLSNVINSAEDIFSKFPKITEYIQKKDKLDENEWKAALAFFDHTRSIFIQTFHSFSYLKTMQLLPNNINVENTNEKLRAITSKGVNDFYNLLDMKLPEFRNIRDLGFVLDSLSLIKNTLANLKGDEAKIGEKAVRGISETDNPYFNRIYAISAKNRIQEMGIKNIVLVGMHYGGVELPFVVKRELENKGIDAETVSVHYSKYSNKYCKKPSSIFDVLDRDMSLEGKTAFIIDDGVFSGDSMYKIGQLFAKEGALPIFSAQAIGTSRRLGHLMARGGINPSFLTNELKDNIIRVSPFKKVKNKSEFLTEDCFNLVKIRVRRMLENTYPNSIHNKA